MRKLAHLICAYLFQIYSFDVSLLHCRLKFLKPMDGIRSRAYIDLLLPITIELGRRQSAGASPNSYSLSLVGLIRSISEIVSAFPHTEKKPKHPTS